MGEVVFHNEAEALSQYLIGKSCRDEIRKDFGEAVAKLNIDLTEKQAGIYKKMLSSFFLMRAIDGGLAFVNPQSLIRKRVFVMLALLEASKYYTDDFLPQQRSWIYFFLIGFRLVFAFMLAVIGVIIIKVLGIE